MSDPTDSKIVLGSNATEADEKLAKLVYEMARGLVDDEDQVRVEATIGENTTVLELYVAKTDLGKIIGKAGRTAKAVRTVLNGASTKLRKRSVMEIVE